MSLLRRGGLERGFIQPARDCGTARTAEGSLIASRRRSAVRTPALRLFRSAVATEARSWRYLPMAFRTGPHGLHIPKLWGLQKGHRSIRGNHTPIGEGCRGDSG
jgi:hypothetical protein